MMAGRPEEYTPEIAARICEAVSTGWALTKFCKSDDALPTAGTVFNWTRSHPDFGAAYEEAKLRRLDVWAEECEEIADDSGFDIVIDPVTMQPKVDGQAIARSKLRIQTKQWFMTKLKRDVYGDVQKQIVEGNLDSTLTHKADPALVEALKGKLR